ncbi:MAG: diguanylate cyclase [Myxococcaceae bacterium]|nr:diguanylate cyclase [Myxococcaceae bacterium]
MQQVLAVAASHDWPTGLDLRPYSLNQVCELDPNSVLSSIEAVILVPGSPEKVAAATRIIAEARRDADIALLLAGRPRLQSLDPLLNEHHFDGVLDLDWPESLLCASIETAVRNVQIGRNVIEIQRAVFEQARPEAASLQAWSEQDDLTQLFNHRYFAELMAREHDRSRRRGLPYALVFLDLDNLHELNTRHGPAVGSRALRELAQVLTDSLRSSDAAVRIGGDSFVLFLSGCTKASAAALADRLCQRLRERPFLVGETALPITVSAGVASFPEDAELYPELLARADVALLWAKASGRNRAVGWTPELAPSADEPGQGR